MNEVPISEKYTLTLKEAAKYFNIDQKKLCRLAEMNLNNGLQFTVGIDT